MTGYRWTPSEDSEQVLTEECAGRIKVRRQVSLHAYLHRALHRWRLLVIGAGDEGDVGRHLVVGELALAGKVHQAEFCGHSVGHHETVCLWTQCQTS